MIRILHKNIQQEIILKKDILNILCIENQEFYREVLYGLNNQLENNEEYFCFFDDKNEELNASKYCCLIENPLHVTLDEKKLTMYIQKDLSVHADVNDYENYETLLNKISEYLDSLTYDYPVKLKFDAELSLLAFLKAFSVGYDGTEDSYLQYLLQKIKVLNTVFGYSVFCIVNLYDYLDNIELETFKKEIDLMEVDVFVISSHMPIDKLEFENIIHIDKDLCEI